MLDEGVVPCFDKRVCPWGRQALISVMVRDSLLGK